jgi:hypothetical protein
MALFGSKKKEVLTAKKIRPTVVRTQNVAKELMALAQSYETKVESIDFNILDVQTFTRMNDGVKETEWEEIFGSEIYEIDDESALLNPHFQIKQMYEIEFFSKDATKDRYKNLHLAVGANASKCKVYLSIKQGSQITYSPEFEEDLKNLINKRKVRAGILINIFDEMLSGVISKLVAHVRVEESVTYEQNETLLIAESYEPTPTVNDELILHYEKKEEVSENEKIDYASRGFIDSVLENELLIEYIKAKKGKPGRNCRGEFMLPKEAEIHHAPTFTIDETIKQVEDEDSIKYYSNESGYISLEGNSYTVKTEVDVGEISFKTTGSITAGLDSEVNISVKEADAVKDAIGTGMTVEVSEIEIDGNVGSNAKVYALKAIVGGQTHKTSEIRADELEINVHKGSAYGKKIHITRLEHGVIDGDEVEVTQALGGEIRAKKIDIEICSSYVKATASKLIEIKKLHGSENIFTIDPLLKKGAKSDKGENEESINKLELELKDLKKEILKYNVLIKNNTAAFNDLKKRLLHYKKNGVKMPESFVKKYKQFQSMKEKLVSLQKEQEQKDDQLTLLTTRTVSFQDDIFDARIINRDRWSGHNQLKFKMVDPAIEVTFNPPEGSPDKVFGLVEVNEGEYEIQAVKE